MAMKSMAAEAEATKVRRRMALECILKCWLLVELGVIRVLVELGVIRVLVE